MTGELDEFRWRYTAIRCTPNTGTPAAKRLGCGSRALFVAACDGREVVVYDTVGRRTKLAVDDLGLDGVYDEKGRKLQFGFDPDTGHLLSLGRSYVDSDGQEVEEWVDHGPWKKFSPEYAERVRLALKGAERKGEGDMGPLALQRLF